MSLRKSYSELGLIPPREYTAPTGREFYLGNRTGLDTSDGNPGTKTQPFSTLDYAIGQCTDNAGDVIYILPGHAETITGAGGITIDKAGVRIVGLGIYDSRPAFLMDGGTSVTMLVTAANSSIENCIFRAGHADIVIFGLITAKGFMFKDCLFEDNTTAENFLGGISVGAADNDADGFEFVNNMWTSVTASSGVITFNKNQKDVRIVGNFFTADVSATPYAIIYMVSTEIPYNFFVADNVARNDHDGNGGTFIDIQGTGTGSIVRNLGGYQDTSGTPFLGGSGVGLFFAKNYGSGVMGTASGYLYPGTDS